MTSIHSKNGFTLVELVIVMGILAFVITSMVQLFIFTSVQADLAGNKTTAVTEAQSKIEEIREESYDDIVTNYGTSPGDTFTLVNLDGQGKIYIDNSNSELLELEIVISWRDKYDRIIGEDTNLNGVLDTGEDVNANGQLDSPVKVMSMITRR